MRQQDEVRDIVRRAGVVARKDHPALAGAMARLRRQGDLVDVLPGVYSVPRACGEEKVRLAALARWAPEAVLTGSSAARMTYWPTLSGSEVECALRWAREPRAGYRFSRRRVPPELVVERNGFGVTAPSLTALDLAARTGGEAIDRALRTRTATLDSLWEAFALTAGRSGNADRRAALVDSRDQPWSTAERLAHRLLRAAGMRDWRANHPVTIDGQNYFLDIAFTAPRLVVEIDGRLHEEDGDLFESDRWRQNALVLDGWTVLRFTWRMLEDDPEDFVERVRSAIRSIRSASRAGRPRSGAAPASGAPD